MNIADYFDDLVQFEGCTTWLYCDSRGFPTVGIGNYVPSPDACARLPFCHRGGQLAASDDEKRTAWARVNDAFQAGKTAAFYEAVTDLRLSMDVVKSLVAHRLELEFIPGIIRLCHDFEDWPLPARKAIVDMAYNLGVGGLAKFHNLLAAAQAHDWATCAHECHRSTSRDIRNAWTSQCFIDADVASR